MRPTGLPPAATSRARSVTRDLQRQERGLTQDPIARSMGISQQRPSGGRAADRGAERQPRTRGTARSPLAVTDTALCRVGGDRNLLVGNHTGIASPEWILIARFTRDDPSLPTAAISSGMQDLPSTSIFAYLHQARRLARVKPQARDGSFRVQRNRVIVPLAVVDELETLASRLVHIPCLALWPRRSARRRRWRISRGASRATRSLDTAAAG